MVNDQIGALEVGGIMNVLVYAVGIATSSESESWAVGGIVAAVLCCPWRTNVSPSVAGNVLLDPLGGILARGISRLVQGVIG